MSNFKTQRLANQFPLWTQIRKDPSSLGQRLFSVYAEYFDEAETEIYRMKDELFLLKWHLGKDNIWSIYLADEDYLDFQSTAGGFNQVVYPASVTASHATLGDILLHRDSVFEDFLYGVPNRLSLRDTETYANEIIWTSSAETTINDIAYPERLTVNITNSTHYAKKSIFGDRYASDFTGLIIYGKDINNVDIEEAIRVRDDGVYTTRNFFKALTKAPAIDGFDGQISIGYKHSQLPYVKDNYKIAVLEEVEGPLKLNLETVVDEEEEVESFTILNYFTDYFKRGDVYRRGIVNIDNTENLGSQVLLNSDSENIIAQDLCVSYENTKLYVLDSSSVVHVYEHGLHAFDPPAQNIATRTNQLELIPLQHYVPFNQTNRMWTKHARVRDAIDKVQIKRIDPDGVIEYLQANKTWGPGPHNFLGDLNAKSASGSWQDFDFQVAYNKLGQWDFYITSWEKGAPYTFYTAVMVDALIALASIPTELEISESIFFSREGYLTISDGNNFYKFKEHRDTYFADPENQQLLFREEYTQIEVIK